MKLSLDKLYAAAIVTIMTVGCSSPNKDATLSPQMLCASWDCEIAEDDIRGRQTITFDSDDNFSEIKKFDYSSADSGFKFNIACEVRTSGRWQLRKDTIVLNYDDAITVIPDSSSFQIAVIDSVSAVNIQDEVRKDMLRDISRFLTKNITTQFRNISGKYYPLGTIKGFPKDTLLIETGNSIVKLVKSH